MADAIKLLTVKETAKLLTVSTKTIRRWVAAKEFPAPIILAAGTIRFRESAILTWLDKREADGRPLGC